MKFDKTTSKKSFTIIILIMMMEMKQFVMEELSPKPTITTTMKTYKESFNNKRQRFYYCSPSSSSSSSVNFPQIHSIIVSSRQQQYCSHKFSTTITPKHVPITNNLTSIELRLVNDSLPHNHHYCSSIIIFIAIIVFVFAEIVTPMTTLSTKSMTIKTTTIPLLMDTSSSSVATISTILSESSSSSIKDTDSKMKLIKKLSDRDEQLSTLNAEKERCEQMNFTRKLPVDYYFDDYNSNQDIDNDDNSEQRRCPIVWDGALCWPESVANSIVHQRCPEYVKGFNHQGWAYKNCTENGTWFYNNETKRFWTDYSECIITHPVHKNDNQYYHHHHHHHHHRNHDNNSTNHSQMNIVDHDDDDEVSSKMNKIRYHLPNFQIISHLGYSISFISLVVAFFILVYVKRLRCPRNSLHLQLFISFIMRSSMYLIKTSLEHFPFDLNQLNVNSKLKTNTSNIHDNHDYHHNRHQQHLQNSLINSIKLEDENDLMVLSNLLGNYDWENSFRTSSIACKVFTTIWQYSLLANYNWIFMEGLYLHNVIFLNIFNDNSNIIPYIILGWCLPIPIVTTWALMRSLYEDTRCWTTNSNLKIFWIMRAPITIVIVLNFVFFVNIIRVLFLKMFAKSAATYARKYKYRTWFRSTLVLVPLFGVHYMFFLAFTTITFNSYDIFEIIWLYTDLTFTTFQGCLVALLYCFLNHEVQIELKKLWISCKQHLLSRHFSLGYNHSTMSGNNNGQQQQPQTTNHQTNNLSSRITKHSLISNCSSFFRRETDPNTSSELNRYSIQYQQQQSPKCQNQASNNRQEYHQQHSNNGHFSNKFNSPLSTPACGQLRLHCCDNDDDIHDNVEGEEVPTDPDMINKLILIGETAI
ncbi:uncharacterized protein LOC113799705 isoform X2 [Dermatophagoides pteronyssinus]|uniref:uncharacterized protein LOC113799705 isoform X2 n=1 Tax=Dermatophagoides pteronyssinus TaxID=6956 RepID=UPI003F67A211